MRDHRFVFVGGLHRSGTTLIARAIAEHPDISRFQQTGVPGDEGQHLQDVYPSARSHGGPGRFGFDAKAHLTEESPLVSGANAQRLFSEWARHWDLRRSVLLEKSPPNMIRTRFLQALFPESYFVVVTRHPIPVVLATFRKGWCSDSVESQLRHWLRCHELFQADQRQLRNALVLSYEDFVQDPGDALGKIWRMLGLNVIKTTVSVEPAVNNRYFQQWREACGNDTDRNARAELEKRFDARFAEFGYAFATHSHITVHP